MSLTIVLIFATIFLLTSQSDLQGQFVIAQFGDSVGASPVNRSGTSFTFPSTLMWIGDRFLDSDPVFARGNWTYRMMLKGTLSLDGIQDHVLNPIYQTT